MAGIGIQLNKIFKTIRRRRAVRRFRSITFTIAPMLIIIGFAWHV